MGLTIITDVRPGEPDILTPVQDSPLTILGGFPGDRFRPLVVSEAAPLGGWTHESLVKFCDRLPEPDDTYDAYLGAKWVGGSEV